MHKSRVWILFVATLVILSAEPSRGGGLVLYELGAPDVGLASAGYAARAQDAATAVTNPAGMARLEKSELMLGAQLLYGDVRFTPGPDTTHAGSDGGNIIEWLPGGAVFYVHNASPDLKIGFSTYGNFGLAYEYDEDWVGRYHTKEGTLIGLTLAPSISYRISPQFSLGVALNAMYGVFSTKTGVNNLGPQQGDGEISLENEDWGLGATLGLLYEISGDTRMGLTYTSQISLDFDDRPDFSGLGPGLSAILERSGLADAKLGLEMTVPQRVMFSAYHALDDRWAILGNLGWEDWSRFGKVGIRIDAEASKSLTVDAEYKDTWHAAVGAQYKASDDWLVSFGMAYDSGMMDDEDRPPELAAGEAWRFGVGAIHDWSQTLQVGFGYTLAWSGDLPMDQEGGLLSGRLQGEYEDVVMHFFAVNFRWTF
ncbi:MAG: transporter [Desulfobacterales bacterium]|nr:transporter [Desulfobacterales bacterium]